MMELNKPIKIRNNAGVWELYFVRKMNWSKVIRTGLSEWVGCIPRIEFHKTDETLLVTVCDANDTQPTVESPNKVVVFEPTSQQVSLYEYYSTEYDDNDEIYCESI